MARRASAQASIAPSKGIGLRLVRTCEKAFDPDQASARLALSRNPPEGQVDGCADENPGPRRTRFDCPESRSGPSDQRARHLSGKLRTLRRTFA